MTKEKSQPLQDWTEIYESFDSNLYGTAKNRLRAYRFQTPRKVLHFSLKVLATALIIALIAILAGYVYQQYMFSQHRTQLEAVRSSQHINNIPSYDIAITHKQ